MKEVYFLIAICILGVACQKTEEEVQTFLEDEYEKDASLVTHDFVEADFNFATDVNNPEKEEIKLNETLKAAEFNKKNWNEVFKPLDTSNFTNEYIKRQVAFLKILGNAALDDDKLKIYTSHVDSMTNIYSTGKICPFTNLSCNLQSDGLSLEPDIESILATSTDYDELVHVWKAWRDVTGKKMKETYKEYVTLSNEAAKINGFRDKGDMWKNDYQTEDFEVEIDRLWKQVEPLYGLLHRFVGRKLKELYGPKLNIDDGLIPAHVFGNMWAQSWINLQGLVRPYPNAGYINVTSALQEQNYTVLDMFEMSNNFYLSLGLETNNMSYNEMLGAVINKPPNKEILCHASAWDFSDKTDFRIKMCTEVNYEDFITIHHEMGHIQYFILYKNQPIAFRNGANPGFHEAVGDTIALSVATPKHLMAVNLLQNYTESIESDLNSLMDMALERVAFLPFGLLIDKWRWDVFAGKVNSSEWNNHWWHYRETIQKVKAPVERSADDFDPGAKFHVPGDSQYINYFVAHILEFQLYRSFCKLAGEYEPNNPAKPLHKCDFYKNKDVGDKLRAGLSLGASKHWKDALETMTNERDLDGSAIIEYFQPLYDYLENEEMKYFLPNIYEKEASSIANKVAVASWNYATDINNATNINAMFNATLEQSKFIQKHWLEVFNQSNIDTFQDEAIQRQVKLLKVIGKAALSETKFQEFTTSINNMVKTYSTAKICPYNKPSCNLVEEGLSLEPDIEKIIAESVNYDELVYLWSEWHNVTGKKIKETYQVYVDLSNEAAVQNGFSDNSEMWKSFYESDSFEDDIEKLWKQIEPLYSKLHSYVARKLKKRYGDQIDIEDGLIPAHVLGNMWGQSWINLASIARPNPTASSINVTDALIKNGYDVLKMFNVSDEFYQSLGFESSAMSYGDLAVIVKPEDKEMMCNAGAFDFHNKKDFRIKMCTEVNYKDFITVHHEMGHIQYFILYKDQPIAFRNGANPGFHEAVGNAIALSVATPNHLRKIGLIDDSYKESIQADLNTLMDKALERVADLPFSYLIDKWRWDVFSGKVDSTQWNNQWWHYRNTIQKLKTPIPRSLDDFDPGAKFHVAGDLPYINYFIGHVLEFQLYRSMCKTAGQYDPETKTPPLHKCDFYQSKEAGEKIKKSLALGTSKHWKEVLKEMTGEDDLDAAAILEYFDPLINYFDINDEANLTDFLENEYEKETSIRTNELVHAQWNFNTNITDETEQIQLNITLKMAKYSKEIWTERFKDINEDDYTDEALKRQIHFLKVLGDSALEEDKLSNLSSATSHMTNIYSTAKVCPYTNRLCDLQSDGLVLEPDIESILAQSRDYNELKYIWSAWRNATGVKMKESYKTYVNLSNEAATINGFNDKGELWRYAYESPTFINDMDRLWEQVKPLYYELHKYVGKKLKNLYAEQLDIEDGLLDAHVFGNMWAQSWINIADIVKPYPNATVINVTAALIDKGYNVTKMFDASNEFYTSLGLESCSMSYGEKAVIEKPENREILCHASAWDFSDKEDYRIKMCTEVNYEDFITIHHEMGHIEYDILYKDQLITFRDGANPGFHEAVGDTIALSVATPKHLKKIGLLDEYEDSPNSDINTLMDMALERVAFLPFGLLIDKWRWDVFAGTVTPDQWNSHWWHYRKTIQKLKPPVPRDDLVDFDPGAKYHVPGDSQYINYFFAHILEFQLYKALCVKAGHFNSSEPEQLHKCDYYNSTEAGDALRAGLELGKSKHWKEVLEKMTGSKELDASALLEYFQPLYDYLKKSNGPLKNENELSNFLKLDYELSASKMNHDSVLAEWNFVTDVSNIAKETEQIQASSRLADFSKFYRENYFKDLNETDYDNEQIKRQVKKLKNLGNAALDADQYKEYVNTTAEMTNIYSTAKICPFEKQDCDLEKEGLSLEPDIELIMATSDNYEELVYAWDSWRNASGKKIKEKFPKYVNLSNEAAKANGFSDKGDMWRSSYESPDFINDIDRLWNDVKPLYNQLHMYVAKKLAEKYKNKYDAADNLIPAHLLGNMWAQTWTNLFSLVKPYPEASAANITEALQNQNYTPFKMFVTSDDFYKSLGLESNAMSYDVSLGAVIEKPSDRDILCHASAWDFYDGKDFRIKMCTEVNHEDFITVHHEMGHIQYFLQYKNQPVAFRDAANPGFHEAVGDAIALSVATPKHLKIIGLLENYEDTQEASINSLMEMALERVAFLPYGLIVDKWRWDVFSGKVSEAEWNSKWWEYRKEYQGLKPPVSRREDDFDPGAKYHVAGDSQYINYFVARILQFQIYKALCKEAGEYTENVPLHKCDFYNSTAAGELLSKGLSLGSSEHWEVALERMTGEKTLNADALLEYFAPLMEYLKAQNPEEDTDQTVPIVVGSVIGVLLVGGLSFYGYVKHKRH